MKSVRLRIYLFSAVFMVLSVSACASTGRGSQKTLTHRVPEEIVHHFLSHPQFSTVKTEPSDLEWLVYSEEEDRTVVGATFKAKDRSGNHKDWYYLTAFEPGTKGEAPKELYGALASIDDPDFDASSFSVREVDMPSGEKKLLLITTGIAGDPEVQKVVLETSEGRTLEATMYERFYLVAEEAVGQNEKVTKTIGYSADGTQLYQDPPFVVVEGLPPVTSPSDIPEYVIRHFYDRQAFATDVEWRLCIEKDGEVTVGATYTGVSKTGPVECFFFAIYTTTGKPLRGTYRKIDGPGLTIALDAFGLDYDRMDPPWIGYVSDERVAKVVCETNKGRSVEASMHGPFWIATIDGPAGEERVTDFVAYDAEGVELYRVKR